MASASKFVEGLKKVANTTDMKSISSDRKTIMIKLPENEYNNLTKLVQQVNKNAVEKVSKQSVIYKVLKESGLLDDLKNCKDCE